MTRVVCPRLGNVVRFGVVLASLLGLLAASKSLAHFPDTADLPVRPRFDPIPEPGNHLPSPRERYNRPTYFGGKIAYWISPTSQEAISWHRAVHRGYYANHAPRMEDRYYYPKPWEALTVGPRIPLLGTAEGEIIRANSYTSPNIDGHDEPFEHGPTKPAASPPAY